MSIIDRIFLLKEERNLTNKQVEQGAGLASSSLSQWKAGKGKPSMDNIIKLSRFFDVTSDYLLCLSEDRKGKSALSEEEKLIVEIFQNSNPQNRFRLIQLCMNILDQTKQNDQ